MDQDPPSTQVAGRLFVDSANRPLKVFVDAAVVNRVKVGRALKVRKELQTILESVVLSLDYRKGERTLSQTSRTPILSSSRLTHRRAIPLQKTGDLRKLSSSRVGYLIRCNEEGFFLQTRTGEALLRLRPGEDP